MARSLPTLSQGWEGMISPEASTRPGTLAGRGQSAVQVESSVLRTRRALTGIAGATVAGPPPVSMLA